MYSSLRESFQQFSYREQRDLQSRYRLSKLLDEQIDQNEQLRIENYSLVENQRKLLYLLHGRDQQIARLQHEKPLNDTHNSTMEQTRIHEHSLRNMSDHDNAAINKASAELASLKYSYEAAKNTNHNMQKKIEGLSSIILQKDQEVERAKMYNMEVYEKMEAQHYNDYKEILRLKERLYAVTTELYCHKKELIYAREILTEQSQTVSIRQIEEIESLKLDYQNQLRNKDRLIKEKEHAIYMHKAHNLYLSRTSESLENKLRDDKEDYEKRIEELEESLSSTLERVKENYILVQKYEKDLYTTQDYLVAKKSEVVILSQRASRAYEQLKQQQQDTLYYEETIGELRDMVNRVRRYLDQQIRNNNNLRKEIIELEKKARNEQEKSVMEESKLEYLQLTIEQLNQRNYRNKEEADKVVERLQRENYRKDKHIVYLKKMQSKLYAENDNYKNEIEYVVTRQTSQLEAAVHKEKRLKEDYLRLQYDHEKHKNMNSALKRYLENMESRVKSCIASLEEKNVKLQNDLYLLNEKLKSSEKENDNLKRMYEKSELELRDTTETLEAKHREGQTLRKRVLDLERTMELNYQKMEQIINDSKNDEYVGQLRKYLNETKVRIASLAEQNNKAKLQNTELVKETIKLNEYKTSMISDLEKTRVYLKQLRSEKAVLEARAAQLQQTLQEKSSQVEKSSPYITRLVEEKKELELDKVKLTNEVKQYNQLLEISKKSKAEYIAMLNKKVAGFEKLQARLENYIRYANETIQNNNREKVNMLRENTLREDHYIKLESDNKRLMEYLQKKDTVLLEYYYHLSVAYKILSDANDKTEKYAENERYTSKTVSGEHMSRLLDVSPIRTSSSAKMNEKPSLVSNTRSSVQQKIKHYKKYILGDDDM